MERRTDAAVRRPRGHGPGRHRVLRWMALVLLATVCAPAFARIDNANPNVIIALLGPEVLTFTAPGQSLADGIALRVVDVAGQPVAGLTVSFGVDVVACPVGAGATCGPEPGTYGHFGGALGVSALTDENGVARSGPFRSGAVSGQYGIYAVVPVSITPRNEAVLQPPVPAFAPRATILAVQIYEAEAVPVTPPSVLVALAAMLAVLGVLAIRPGVRPALPRAGRGRRPPR